MASALGLDTKITLLAAGVTMVLLIGGFGVILAGFVHGQLW
jgi:hypothetical protein